MKNLFYSSAPPGDSPVRSPLIEWDECLYCEHGHQHRSPAGSALCSCKLGRPTLPREEDLDRFIALIEAAMGSGSGLDWSLPVDEGEQNLEAGQPPHESAVAEWLSELAFFWNSLVARLGWEAGRPHPPRWWVHRGAARARRANLSWHVALLGSGVRGTRTFFGGDEIFLASGIALSKGLLLDACGVQVKALEAQGHAVDIIFDAEGGVAAMRAPAPAGSVLADRGCEVRQRGARVRLHGLGLRPELNGREGEIVDASAHDAAQADQHMMHVDLGGDGGVVHVRPANLQCVRRSEGLTVFRSLGAKLET